MSERAESKAGIGSDSATRSAGRALRFEMLGAIRVTLNGSAVNLGGTQQRAVLALLLIDSDTSVPVARLADALWGGHPPPGNATTIQTYVFHLREALEPERPRGAPGQVIVSEHGGYRLDTSGAVVDAHEFEDLTHAGLEHVRHGEYEQALGELDAAVALWRGNVFADVSELESVAPVAVRLNELRLTAIEARVDALLALGRHTLVVGELDELTAANPLRERLYAQRMLALYQCGRQADALAVYRRLREILDDEIGVEPSPPLRVLHQAILAHDPSLTDGITTTAGRAPVGAHDEPTTGGPATARRPRRRGRRMLIAAATAVVVAAGTGAAVVVTHGKGSSLKALPPNSVGSIHRDGSLHDAVPVGQSPTAIVYAAGSLWVANGGANTVSRINPRTHAVVDEIPVGANPVAITATSSSVWVANAADGTVDRINVSASGVVGEPIKVGNQPGAIAAGPSGVWVANTGDDTVRHIDPDTSRVDAAIAVGGQPAGITAVDADSIWVANRLDGTVSQVNPHTGDVRAPIHVGAGPTGIAIAGGSVWVANSLEQSVTRIDRATGAVNTVPDVGDGPASPVSDGRFLWVASSHTATIARINPASSSDIRRFETGASPVALATTGSSVYVATQAFAAPGHLGGTLTVGTTHLPGAPYGIDPANLYFWWTMAAERFVYDGLVTYQAANGFAGFTLVPDLAARMPTMSQDGKTYTFTLRTGIRYSTGRPVDAEDFVRGFGRVFTVGGYGNPGLFDGVRGADQCLAHPTISCDLSHGVVADNVRHTLAIHLTAPDASFLHKLACFVYPTPPGMSPRQVTTTPIPGTGPYQIAGVRREPAGPDLDTVFDQLIRNKYFKQWSFAAQPAGYPDVINFKSYSQAEDIVGRVHAGTVDVGLVDGGDTAKLGPLVASLQARDPDRLHTLTRPAKWWVALNTQAPPFDNKLARQAINYALDRQQLIKDVFGPGMVEPTCQMLPPNFPAYEPYCPYSRAPNDNHYHGPDLAKARELVKKSGTLGALVTVYALRGGPSERAIASLAKALGDIGYKAATRTVPNTTRNTERPYNVRNGVQIFAPDGWIADYPLPDAFYGPLLSCRSKVATTAGFCNKGIDELAAAAQRAALTDPGEARRRWTEIDHAVTDEAPWVTLGPEVTFHYTSSKVGNYQSTPFNPLYDQLWVR